MATQDGDPAESPANRPARVDSGYVDQRRRILVLKGAGCFFIGLVLIGSTPWESPSLVGSLLKGAGQSLVLSAVLGRLWATLYIGGRKNACLVTTGPYSMSRNPLYLFSTLGAFGVGLLFGSVVASVALGGVTCLALHRAAVREAALLERSFGAAYAAYAQRVPLFWPRFALFDSVPAAPFDPAALGRAARDALLFLLALPASELLEHARSAGLLPRIMPLF